MSGFEVVGVILGAYPLIQGALDAYRATKGGKGAISLARQLKTEEIIFKEFVHHLLAPDASGNGLAQYESAATIDLAQWRNYALRSDLKDRVGKAKAENLIMILEEIRELLTSLQAELAPGDRGVELLRKFRARMRQVRFNMPQSSLKERLDKLTSFNTQLQRLLMDRALPSQPAVHRRPGPSKEYLWRDRSHAVDIYHALCDGYQCECAAPHRANFCFPRISEDSDLISAWQHELIFAVEEATGREMVPRMSSDPDELTRSWSNISMDSNTVRRSRKVSITQCDENYCRAQQKSTSDLCIFAKSLDSEDAEPDCQVCVLSLKEKQYSLQTPATLPGVPPNVEYLDQLLDDPYFLQSRKERICLALSLSHAVLSFYSTPWVEACWTWNDFCIDRKNEGQLFAARKFYSSQNKSGIHECRQPLTSDFWAIRGEPTLTRLGFALTELALGKRLAELRSQHQFQSSDPDTLDFLTAKALVDSGWVMRAESQAYEDVVKACLRHQFISNSEVIGLDSSRPTFQENAERSIILPLHTIVMASWGTA